MQSVTLTAALFVVLFAASAESFVHSKTFVLAVQECNGQPSLHGLWWQDADYCSGAAFDNSLLAPISSELAEYWPSCAPGGMSSEAFHQHEWERHGTCSGLGELQFFTTALNLFKQYGLNSSPPTHICFPQDLSAPIPCPSADGDGDSDSSSASSSDGSDGSSSNYYNDNNNGYYSSYMDGSAQPSDDSRYGPLSHQAVIAISCTFGAVFVILVASAVVIIKQYRQAEWKKRNAAHLVALI